MLITQFPENDDYFLKRGICKFQQKKYDESLDDFLHCLSLNPNNSFADFNISVTYNIKKEYKNAINYAMKAKVLGYNVTQDYLNELRKNQKW